MVTAKGNGIRPEVAKAAKPDEPKRIVIHRMNWGLVKIKIVGESSYISNNFGEEKKKKMLVKQTTAPDERVKKGPREARNIEEEWRGTLRPFGKGYGIPTSAFHTAMVRAVKTVDGLAMTDAKMLFRVVGGDLVLIQGCEPNMREDYVKNADGSADIRFRAEFKNWHTEITVKYNADLISAQDIANLAYRAGQTVGIGDKRPYPAKGAPGTHGVFTVG